jgi:FAD/FMN-containing dehydrogenase
MPQTSGPSGLLEDVNREDLEGFLGTLRGSALRPDTEAYEKARVVFNRMHERRPGLIVKCSGTADVVAALKFAALKRLLVATRAGGHSVGADSSCQGGLVIDLSEMTGVHVDPVGRTARVQGGATWGDLDRETQLHGLAVPGGAVSTTGVAGLTLGGGIGWLRRKHGLSCDSLLSVEIVTADGQVRTASHKQHPDLFWALRGGGGNFGVVTSLEFKLVSVGPMLQVAIPFYPIEDAPKVYRSWRDWVATIPDEVTTHAFTWTIPEDPPVMPPEIRGRAVIFTPAMYAGAPESGEKVLAPARKFATPLFEITGPLPYTAVQQLFDPFFGELGKHLCYWKSLFVSELSDEVIDILVRRVAARPDPWTLINVAALGGAISRVAADETAYLSRSAPFMLSIDGNWRDPARSEAGIAWVRSFWKELEPHSTGAIYLNFLSDSEPGDAALEAAHAVYGASWDRLAALKAKYDPTNLLHVNVNIAPR